MNAYCKSVISAMKGGLSEIALKAVIKTNINIFNYAVKDCDAPINEVLFYGTEDQDEEKTKKVGLNNLFCIYYLMVHATSTIDVCVPSLVSETIANCLIKTSQKNGVKVRVLIHRSDDLSNLQLFSQHLTEVKVINSERLEHEFVLIDAGEDIKDAVAVIGALDYEISRVNCNRDNTILTSEQAVVTALKREFERVWQSVPVYEQENSSQ